MLSVKSLLSVWQGEDVSALPDARIVALVCEAVGLDSPLVGGVVEFEISPLIFTAWEDSR